jgi:hypothetical protein
MTDQNILTKSTKELVRVVNKNSPTILTGLGVGGLLSSVFLSIKATKKAVEILEYEKEFRYQEGLTKKRDTPIDILDTIELTWKCYVPTMAMILATTACMIGSNHISLRRNAALASLLTFTETTLREYQTKVVEEIGKAKEEKIRGEIAQDKLNANPADEKMIVLTGKGNYLCYDTFSGRYFRSDVDILQRKANEFNARLIREGWLSINEFYYEVGLESIELGDEMGWIAERSLLEFKFDTKMAKDKEPCLVIGYTVTPYHI